MLLLLNNIKKSLKFEPFFAVHHVLKANLGGWLISGMIADRKNSYAPLYKKFIS